MIKPIAEVVSAHGDPEAFGQREIKVFVDLMTIPYYTKLYAAPPSLPPLTDEQILSELSRHYCPPNEPGNSLLERVYPGDLVKAVRAIIAQARGGK